MSFPGRLIPDRFLIPDEVVIGLAVVGAVVSGFFQILWEEFHMIRQYCLRSHVVGTQRNRIHPSDDPGTTRSTNAVTGKCVCEQSALGGELVKIRRGRRGVTVTAQLRTNIFATDPDNVWAIGR